MSDHETLSHMLIGWTMDGFELLTDRIEETAAFIKSTGITPTERQAIAIKMMIERQMAIGPGLGDGDDFGDAPAEDDGSVDDFWENPWP